MSIDDLIVEIRARLEKTKKEGEFGPGFTFLPFHQNYCLGYYDALGELLEWIDNKYVI